jgi:hypothetical protein
MRQDVKVLTFVNISLKKKNYFDIFSVYSFRFMIPF